MNGYADVEIRIRKQANGRYPVELRVDTEREFPTGFLDAGSQPPTPTDAHYADSAYGQALFNWFFADDKLKESWAEIRGAYPQRRMRLYIDADEPQLHQVAWEALCEPEDNNRPALHLAATGATPFSRYLASSTYHGKPIVRRPIKILVVAPAQQNFAQIYLNPDQPTPGMATIDPDAEFKSLQKALEQQIPDGKVSLTLLPQPCTLAAIASALLEGYHVLHMICHGLYDRNTQETWLLLANEQNQVKRIGVADFKETLGRQLNTGDTQEDDQLRLVFLATCESAKRSSADAYRGLAPELVAAGVPAVVAMQNQVGEDTARSFAATFYRQLLKHGQIDRAANEARHIVLAANLAGPVIPVLFLRLRTGNLLGVHGTIHTQSSETFWPFLLRNIEDGLCTVFLGPHINAQLLPDTTTLARRLAREYTYPLSDVHNLARVAQYIALKEPKRLRSDYLKILKESLSRLFGHELTKAERKQDLSEVVEALDWPNKIRRIHDNEPYHLLAELPIGLYITTNVDNFLYAALKQQKPGVRREQPHWETNNAAPEQSPRAPYALWVGPQKDDADFRAANPVIFHLNGYDADPDHLVLSEDDHMMHLVRLARDQQFLLPTDLLGALASHSLAFIGFKLDDWEFRCILQGLLKHIDQQTNAPSHIGVQLDVDQSLGQNQEQARKYLETYLGRFKIDVYWGEAQQFVNELHSRWLHFQEAGDYTW
jgi:hypothetical protein